MEFREIKEDIKPLFNEYISEWYDNNDKIVPWSTDVRHHGGFNSMLEMQNEAITPPKNSDFVRAKTFVLIDRGIIVGAANIRYQLNDWLQKVGGHVGYGVRRSERGKGYATTILKYALEELRNDFVEYALITCDEDNFGSAKVIERNGGKEDKPYISESQNVTKRYWIKL